MQRAQLLDSPTVIHYLGLDGAEAEEEEEEDDFS